MNMMLYLLSNIAAILLIYTIVSLMAVDFLKKQLSGARLCHFHKVLSCSCRYKPLLHGITRYKWVFGWITIKADFDHEGHLVSNVLYYIFPERIEKRLLRKDLPENPSHEQLRGAG